MQPELIEKTNNVLCKVMESMAFIFVDPTPSDSLDVENEIVGSYLHAHMKFTGPHTGSINLHLPTVMMSAISANMLGVNEDDEDALSQQLDAVRELLNVICGQVLTEIWGTEPVFDLCIPTVDPIDNNRVKPAVIRPDTTCFTSDEGLVLLEINIDQTA
ncbi:chemotaxis protein CheX [bacterium AH-315-I18]|nr:chemotaxis protein CheX [bacterium AH-315-I18]